MKLKKTKIKAREYLSRLGGVSFLGVGVSFKIPEPERAAVRDLLTFLEDRRALYVGSIWEQPEHVVRSVLKMREELTSTLKKVDEKSPALACCRAMRAACRAFLDTMGKDIPQTRQAFAEGWQGESFLIALGQLRSAFGTQIAVLSHVYGVELEPHLASILPPEA